jgi:hypothetical protein
MFNVFMFMALLVIVVNRVRSHYYPEKPKRPKKGGVDDGLLSQEPIE